jgi:hypothetical protein
LVLMIKAIAELLCMLRCARCGKRHGLVTVSRLHLQQWLFVLVVQRLSYWYNRATPCQGHSRQCCYVFAHTAVSNLTGYGVGRIVSIHRSPIFTNSNLLKGGEGKEVEKPCQVINWFLRNWISSGDELHSDDEFLDDSEVDDFIPTSPSNV